ncbi:MAG: succinate dehydrogenase, cytochrome b556 subunit [Leptothrix sp. (in: b-proteobacteria)]|jgi:succinate dehydrogenase / fumarate reductase cytochrome b subunit
MADTLKQRPAFRNINITDIVSYRLPPAGIVSILHRISGAVLFLLMPFIIWMFDTSVTSEVSFESFTAAFTSGIGFIPGPLVKLAALGLIWAYLQHFLAGTRHLWMEATHSLSKEQGKSTAIATLALSALLTVLLGAKLFGLF